jgi:hypothetical protein
MGSVLTRRSGRSPRLGGLTGRMFAGGRDGPIAIGETIGIEPVTSGQVDVAAGVTEASGEVVERLDTGVAEALRSGVRRGR